MRNRYTEKGMRFTDLIFQMFTTIRTGLDWATTERRKLIPSLPCGLQELNYMSYSTSTSRNLHSRKLESGAQSRALHQASDRGYSILKTRSNTSPKFPNSYKSFWKKCSSWCHTDIFHDQMFYPEIWIQGLKYSQPYNATSFIHFELSFVWFNSFSTINLFYKWEQVTDTSLYNFLLFQLKN